MKFKTHITTIFLYFGILFCSAQDNQQSFWHDPKPPSQQLINQTEYQKNKKGKSNGIYHDMIVPGEYEEVKAIIITWSWRPEDWPVQAKMIDAIQQEAEAWIMINSGQDSVECKAAMATEGVILSNHKFIFRSEASSVWIRDYGPIYFYYNNLDSIGIIDVKYQLGRINDDAVSAFYAAKDNLPLVSSALQLERGNLMTDGFGTGFYSDIIFNATDVISFYPWTSQIVTDSMKSTFNFTTTHEITPLNCDGGTQHLDIYISMLDEETFAITQYDTIVTAQDRLQIEDNIAYLQSINSTYNRPYRIKRLISAHGNDTGQPYIDCNDWQQDIRGYANTLFVNKSILVPIFSIEQPGMKERDSIALEQFRKLLPGYKVVPIDSRVLTVRGGAVHCITINVPADNPIRFWHPSIRDVQALKTDYNIEAKITNSSGIESAICKWRMKGDLNWNTVSLTENTGLFDGAISGSFNDKDTIEYYLEATSNNGKTMTKPIVAPEGYYTFIIDETLSTNESTIPQITNHLFAAYPNPSTDVVYIPYLIEQPSDLTLSIYDLSGKVILKKNLKSSAGKNIITINEDISPGMYFYNMYSSEKLIGTRKFIIKK